jgi:hypothetical protein
MCVRISRDSYPNLRALRNASTVSLADAAYVKISEGEFGYVLDDVPHLADYLPDVSTYPNPLQDHPAYSTVKQYFVNEDDTVPQKVWKLLLNVLQCGVVGDRQFTSSYIFSYRLLFRRIAGGGFTSVVLDPVKGSILSQMK